ncbi:MAG: hypothetical protein ACRD19_00015 [Terriglobia bacterium]
MKTKRIGLQKSDGWKVEPLTPSRPSLSDVPAPQLAALLGAVYRRIQTLEMQVETLRSRGGGSELGA